MGSPSVAIIGTRGYPSYYGGFETAVRHLAPYLADQGWDVLVYGRPGATRDADPDMDQRVTTRRTRGVESKSLSTLSYGLTSILHAARTKPDVALVMNVANGYWLPILKARKIPTLVNVDGIEWDRAKWGRVAKGVFHNGARMTAKFGSRLVYDSLEIQRRWAQEFGRDGDFIPYGGTEPPPLELEEGLVPDTYVLMVARFVPENSVGEFFEAAAILAQDHDVVIVGSSGYGGELDDQAAALAARHRRVRCLGHVNDDRRLLALWQHAGVYFHGHSVGGTNPALVQAMACGTPTVARDTVYNREVIGATGIFVPPVAVDIAHAISELLGDADARKSLSARLLARARSTYSWQAVNAAYARSLSALAER